MPVGDYPVKSVIGNNVIFLLFRFVLFLLLFLFLCRFLFLFVLVLFCFCFCFVLLLFCCCCCCFIKAAFAMPIQHTMADGIANNLACPALMTLWYTKQILTNSVVKSIAQSHKVVKKRCINLTGSQVTGSHIHSVGHSVRLHCLSSSPSPTHSSPPLAAEGLFPDLKRKTKATL